MGWSAKDPTEILDYSWEVPLDGTDTIASKTAVVVSGTIVVASSSFADGKVTAFITGGVDGETAMVKLTATTTGGRTFEETFQLKIIDSANAFAAAFRAAFPAFADTAPESIEYWRTQAARIADERFGDDEGHALNLLTAHYLSIQPGTMGSSSMAGLTRFKSASVDITVSDKVASATGYAQSVYGQQFAVLQRQYLAAPFLATGT